MRGRIINARDAYIIYQIYLDMGHGTARWICNVMGYCERSYWTIIHNEGHVSQNVPWHRQRLWSESEIQMAASLLCNNPTLTLHEIIDENVHNGFIRISPSTLYRYLRYNVNVTRKKLTRWGQYRNIYSVKIQRIIFFNQFLNIRSRVIWIDEFSVNLQIMRNYGYAENGQRAVMVLPQTLELTLAFV